MKTFRAFVDEDFLCRCSSPSTTQNIPPQIPKAKPIVPLAQKFQNFSRSATSTSFSARPVKKITQPTLQQRQQQVASVHPIAPTKLH